jgi:hypothetical protein
MKHYAFEPILLDGKESLLEKYKRFIDLAYESGEEVLKIDADIIPNGYIREVYRESREWRLVDALMIQYQNYCIYKNSINIGNPVFYRKKAIEIIHDNFDKLDPMRPEASAWRLKEINDWTHTSDLLVGLHGVYQTEDDINRHEGNKIDRKQIDAYDFSIIRELMDTIPCSGCSRTGGDHDGECMKTAS